MEKIDAVYFINLDHRTDRLAEIQKEVSEMGFPAEKVHRISAIWKPEIGSLGCALSHIKALNTFLQSNSDTCLILEDDFMRTIDINFMKFLFKDLFETVKEFDVVMLAGKVFQKDSSNSFFFHRVQDAQTTSAYLITRAFAPKLKQNLEEAAQGIESWYTQHKKPSHEYCIDIYWKKLQPVSRWYIVNPKIGLQRESYSDIENKTTNYRV